MSNYEHEPTDNREFEIMLESSVPDIPPDDIAAKVTPWRKSMRRILIGMTLCAIIPEFLLLNYILPAVGMLLTFLGFRTLRHENKQFGMCFAITAIRMVYLFAMLILNTTVIRNFVLTAPVTAVMNAFNVFLTFADIFCFWQGLRVVQKKVNLPPKAGRAAALIIWYLLICVLSAVKYNGLIIAAVMLIVYLFIIRSVYMLSKELDEAGYSIKMSSVKISDGFIAIIIVITLIIGCACGYLFGGKYPMRWNIVDSAVDADAENIKNHLAELGFPEYVLNDLTPEDIKSCSGAVRVVADVTDKPVNDGRTETTEYIKDGITHIDQKTVYDIKELRITGVGVQVSGEREKWIIFHHFLWTSAPNFYGTESIQLWTAYNKTQNGWAADGEISGRVLYDKDGKTFAAPYYFLGNKTYTADSLLLSGEQTSTDVFAEFSMPNDGENYRGYTVYPITEINDGYIVNSWINYTHQKRLLQYPVVTAAEMRMKNSWNNAGAFRTIQDALQFYPTGDDVEIIN